MSDLQKIRDGFKEVLLQEITSRYANDELDVAAPEERAAPAVPRRREVAPDDSALDLGDDLGSEESASNSRINRDQDRASFDSDRTPGEETADLGTEPLGTDIGAAETKVVESLYRQVEKIDTMVTDLNNPSSEASLNRHLSVLSRSLGEDTSPAVAALGKKAPPLIEKAAMAIYNLKVLLDSVLSQQGSTDPPAPEEAVATGPAARPA